MNRNLLFLLILFSALGRAADIYRWVDERGITQYSEKPPQNRNATLVNARPAAASVDAEGKLIEAPKPAPKVDARPVPPVVVAPPPPPAIQQARGMDFGVYIHLRRSMSEGEVLLRAGKPDHESFDGGRNFVVKSLYYYPTQADPYITVVTLRGGRVANLERTQKTF